MVIRKHGDSKTHRHENMAIRKHGDSKTHQHENMTTRKRRDGGHTIHREGILKDYISWPIKRLTTIFCTNWQNLCSG